VILTDHSKFERTALIRVCGFEDFNRLVTDAAPPPALAARLDEAGIAVEIAGGPQD
jgi:DeoR family glycerol-3-phosphate regulon repressor